MVWASFGCLLANSRWTVMSLLLKSGFRLASLPYRHDWWSAAEMLLSFRKVLLSLQSNAGALSEWPLGYWTPPFLSVMAKAVSTYVHSIFNGFAQIKKNVFKKLGRIWIESILEYSSNITPCGKSEVLWILSGSTVCLFPPVSECFIHSLTYSLTHSYKHTPRHQ